MLWWYRQACIILLSCYTLCSGDTDKHVTYYYYSWHTVLWWYRQACNILLSCYTALVIQTSMYHITIILDTLCSGDTDKHVTYYYYSWYTLCSGDTYKHVTYYYYSWYTLCSGDTDKHVSYYYYSCYTLCSGDTNKHVSYYYLATHCALVIQTSMYQIFIILLHTVLWWYNKHVSYFY